MPTSDLPTVGNSEEGISEGNPKIVELGNLLILAWISDTLISKCLCSKNPVSSPSRASFSLTFVFAVQADCNRQSKHDLLIPDSGRLPQAAFLVSFSLHNAHTHVYKHTNIHTNRHICVYTNAECANTQTNTLVYTQMHTHMCTNTQTYIKTNTFVYTQIHTHMERGGFYGAGLSGQFFCVPAWCILSNMNIRCVPSSDKFQLTSCIVSNKLIQNSVPPYPIQYELRLNFGVFFL